jgi:hypothetical protein
MQSAKAGDVRCMAWDRVNGFDNMCDPVLDERVL